MTDATPPEPGATLAALRDELEGARIVGDPLTRVRDVQHDSRVVHRGDLFVARRGQHADGRAFFADAIARGAAALCSESEVPGAPVPVLVVPDAERALSVAASTVWAHPSFYLEVVGITGTNGKTTTAWLVEHAMRALGMHPAMIGTVTHRFGERTWPALHTTPEGDDLARRMAAMKHAGAEHLVMEVSSHALSLRRVAAGVPVLGMRFTSDPLVPAARFERLRAELGPGFEAIEIDSSPGNPHGIPRLAHSVVTNDLVNVDGHPTRAALDRVLSFLKEQLLD